MPHLLVCLPSSFQFKLTNMTSFLLHYAWYRDTSLSGLFASDKSLPLLSPGTPGGHIWSFCWVLFPARTWTSWVGRKTTNSKSDSLVPEVANQNRLVVHSTLRCASLSGWYFSRRSWMLSTFRFQSPLVISARWFLGRVRSSKMRRLRMMYEIYVMEWHNNVQLYDEPSCKVYTYCSYSGYYFYTLTQIDSTS